MAASGFAGQQPQPDPVASRGEPLIQQRSKIRSEVRTGDAARMQIVRRRERHENRRDADEQARKSILSTRYPRQRDNVPQCLWTKKDGDAAQRAGGSHRKPDASVPIGGTEDERSGCGDARNRGRVFPILQSIEEDRTCKDGQNDQKADSGGRGAVPPDHIE